MPKAKTVLSLIRVHTVTTRLCPYSCIYRILNTWSLGWSHCFFFVTQKKQSYVTCHCQKLLSPPNTMRESDSHACNTHTLRRRVTLASVNSNDYASATNGTCTQILHPRAHATDNVHSAIQIQIYNKKKQLTIA